MRVAASAAALMIAIAGPAAHAAPLLFTVTGYADTGSWLQESDPTPISYTDPYYTRVSVTGATGNFSGATNMLFWSLAYEGGFGPYTGDQIYSNTPANPHFSIGTFNLYGGSLTVSAGPSAPAPLAGAGLLSALAALAALAMTRLIGRKDQLA